MSRISILTHSGEAAPLLTTGEKEPGRAILRDLQLDKTMLLLCPDAAPREALLHAMAVPCTDPEDIRFRYRAGQVFQDHPALLDNLLTTFERTADHCSNMAVEMLQVSEGKLEAHE